MLYVLDRGNLDAYAVLGCFAFTYLVARGRPKVAAVVLAAAAALKVYPAILGILLLRRDTRVLRRDTRAFALFAVLAVAESLLSLWILSQSPATAANPEQRSTATAGRHLKECAGGRRGNRKYPVPTNQR